VECAGFTAIACPGPALRIHPPGHYPDSVNGREIASTLSKLCEERRDGRGFTCVQNRSRQVGNEVQHKRSLWGEAGALSHIAGEANLFPAEIEEINAPRPLGGEGGLQPAFSSAGAGRVRGSKTLGPTEIMSTLRPFHFCLLPLLLPLCQTNSILVKTSSPPRQAERGAPSALRSPLSPKGARENESLIWRRIRDRAPGEPCPPRSAEHVATDSAFLSVGFSLDANRSVDCGRDNGTSRGCLKGSVGRW